MNRETKFKRAWYFILVAIWVVGCLWGMLEAGAAGFGRMIAYLLFFTLFWQLLGGTLVWVGRRLSRGNPPTQKQEQKP